MKYETFKDVDHALAMIASAEELIEKRRKKYDADIAEAQKTINILSSEIEAFCIKNRAKFKEPTKTLDNGTVGFRPNPLKVLQLDKSFTIARTLELLKNIFPGSYVKVKEERNNDEILTDFNAKILDSSSLESVGLRIDRSETFFLSPSTVTETVKIKSEVKK